MEYSFVNPLQPVGFRTHFFLRVPLFRLRLYFFFLSLPPATQLYTLSLHDALPIYSRYRTDTRRPEFTSGRIRACSPRCAWCAARSEEHTSELQSRGHLVCRLLLEKKNSLVAW